MRRRVLAFVLSGLVFCAWGASTPYAQDPVNLSSNFYGIAGDDVIGMGVGYLASDTYLGLEWYAKDASQYGNCDESEQSFTIALTPGKITQVSGKNSYVIHAVLGYYEADYIDTCAYPSESADDGFDYGLGVFTLIPTQSGLGYMLGLRHTDKSGTGITFGISW